MNYHLIVIINKSLLIKFKSSRFAFGFCFVDIVAVLLELAVVVAAA